MTETPPEAPVPVDPVDDTPTAVGVAEDRLTGLCFYDDHLGAYVGGVYPSKTAARKAHPDYWRDTGRYVLVRV